MARLQFDSKPSEGQEAIVVSFDLCGFSDFCNQADAYAAIPKFVSALFDELDRFLMGGFEGWILGANIEKKRVPQPNFIKYTGDGALMIWLAEGSAGFDDTFCTALVAVMRRFQEHIAAQVPQWGRKWRVHRLPERARFGIAKGLVYPLQAKTESFFDGATLDYAGYCINLAVRLQNHCPKLGFLVHALLHPKLDGLAALTALRMKGTRDEPVWAFGTDVTNVPARMAKEKFREGH